MNCFNAIESLRSLLGHQYQMIYKQKRISVLYMRFTGNFEEDMEFI